MSSRTPYRYRGNRSLSGYEEAIRHVQEANALHQKYGAVFDDIKRIFFSLPPGAMGALLRDYGRRYGPAAQNYAYDTIPKWKAGTVKMAGQTMERLLDLVPRHLPPKAKYDLIQKVREESLRRLSQTVVTLDLPADASADAVLGKAIELYRRQCEVKLPPDFYELRGWITQADAQIMQQMIIDSEREILYMRTADLILNIAALQDLRVAVPWAKLIEATFDVPTARVIIRITKAKNMNSNTPINRQDQIDNDLLTQIQRAEVEAKFQSGGMSVQEYMVRNLDRFFSPAQQERLRELAATQGLELEKLKAEIVTRGQTSKFDIEEFKKMVQDFKDTRTNAKMEGTYQTPSGTVKVQASTSQWGCSVLHFAVLVMAIGVLVVML